MGIIVAKFGGSSLSDGEKFNKVIDIIKDKDSRQVIVPSAPGKRFSGDTKVTDLLLMAHAGEDVFDEIEQRYDDIIKHLGLDLDLSDKYLGIKNALKSEATIDYIASRGEYLNAIILAKALGYKFIDAADVIKFDKNDGLLFSITLEAIKNKVANDRCVIPGFYGSDILGNIITFSRGGSDVSGSLCAAALNVDVYENWTDVSGFFMTDPRIVKDAISIDQVSYRELRELSYMGASVLHEDSIFPVRKGGIPVNIRNTNAPQDDGTMILPFSKLESHGRAITGVAGKKGFVAITVEKARMNNEIGFARRVLSVLEEHNVSIEHMPTGIDTLSIVVAKDSIIGIEDKLIEEIRNKACPDTIEITSDIALIATVGHGMVHHTGTAAKIFTALSKANINIRMIDQGSSELNIIVGVAEENYEKAVKAIYHTFV